jgi:hypothetical protein
VSDSLQHDCSNRWQIQNVAAVNLCIVTAIALLLLGRDSKTWPGRIEDFLVRYASWKTEPGTVLLIVRGVKSDYHEQALSSPTCKCHCAVSSLDDLIVGSASQTLSRVIP